MAVESFLPTSDAKMTIEKVVKPKPTMDQLTTIESPGKPVPASNLESKSKKTKNTKKREEILKTKRDSILIITEKPQAAQKIAFSLGNARKYTEKNIPFYELEKDGEKIIVASAVGHLFNLTYSKGQKGWPIFQTEWVPSYEGKTSYTKNYYDLIKKLGYRAKEIIVATDYDIEGEVIGWNVVRFILKKEDAKRMKYSTLTKNELLKSYENSLPTLDWGQAYAGETRHQIDWLYGINLSRALMSAIKRTGSFRVLSIGRVQGPALKIIVDRDREIRDFKPVPFWQVLANSNGIDFKHPKDIFNQPELKEFENIKEADATTTKKQENIQPPHPFDLTSLQREAHGHLNLSPSNTLKLAQSLYLDGIISYPRTSSQKIPKEINPKEILKKLEKNFPEAKRATRENPIEGEKSDPAHPSIYPTGEFKILEGDELELYELIVKRFISAFSADALTANKRIVLNAEGKNFTASGLKVIEKGWTNVYPTRMEEVDLPDMNGKVKVDKIKFMDKETQPPKRYTAASLITLLEKKNLGTKTTRSLIIDTLLARGYLDGKSLEATPLGLKLVEALEKYSPIIVDENLTRDLEEKMDEILNLKTNHKEVEDKTIKQVERLITDISKEFRLNEAKIGEELLKGTEQLREIQKENSILMPCPVCKKGNLAIKYSKKTRKNFVACDAYPECKTTYSLPPNSIIKKTDKVSERNLPMLVAFRKGKKPWFFEFNPNWKEEQTQEPDSA